MGRDSTCHQWQNLLPSRKFSANSHMCKHSMSVCMPPELLLCICKGTVAFPRYIVVVQDIHSGVPKFRDLDQAIPCISIYSKRTQGLHLLLNSKCLAVTASEHWQRGMFGWLYIDVWIVAVLFLHLFFFCWFFFSMTFSKDRSKKILPCFYWVCFPSHSVSLTCRFT